VREKIVNCCFCISIGVHRLVPKSYRSSTVTLPAFTGCHRFKPYFDRQEPGLCRLSWLNRYLHRGHNSCRYATVSPGGLTVEIRFMPKELRLCPGISRRCFAPWWVPVSPGSLKTIWNHWDHFPVNAVFNTVYPDSVRCVLGGPRCPHRSATGTENRDCVNGSITSAQRTKTSVTECVSFIERHIVNTVYLISWSEPVSLGNLSS